MQIIKHGFNKAYSKMSQTFFFIFICFIQTIFHALKLSISMR